MLHSALLPIVNLLFPARCIICSLEVIGCTIPVCPVCLSKLESVDQKRLKKHLQKNSTTLNHDQATYAHWYFDRFGAVQKLHQQLKYGNRPTYGIFLGKLIGHGLKQSNIWHCQPEMIIPVPLHKKRFLERGFNQSAMLAQGISKTLNIPMHTHLLERPRSSRSQTGLSSQQRKINVASAFSVRHSRIIQDKHVLLVDDILTTGSTLLSASRALNDAGARTISLVTLAFTRP